MSEHDSLFGSDAQLKPVVDISPALNTHADTDHAVAIEREAIAAYLERRALAHGADVLALIGTGHNVAAAASIAARDALKHEADQVQGRPPQGAAMSHHYARHTRKPTTKCSVCGAEIPTALADPSQCPVTLESVAEYKRMVAEVEAGHLPEVPATEPLGFLGQRLGDTEFTREFDARLSRIYAEALDQLE